jgi:hypothetical protein
MAAAEEFWFELCRESNVEKKYRQESPNRFGQLSGGAKANSNVSTIVLPGGPFPNRML